MKTVLVTGAAGFLGSHLAKHHLDEGDTVVGVDNCCSSDPNSRHLRVLKSYEGFSFVEGDICEDPSHWKFDRRFSMSNLEDDPIDLIYNFACPASPPQYQAMPVLTMMTCTLGVGNMLDLAHTKGCPLVHASTSEVYGDPEVSPQNESYRGKVNSYGPRACYDEGKRAAEALCFDYWKTYQTDARLVRIFNTYGPNMDPQDGRVVSNFIMQALRGEKLTIYGDGKQGRSFCYVNDLIRGIVAMGALEKNPEGPINLGNPYEFTVYDLAMRVLAMVQGKPLDHSTLARDIVTRPLPTDDPTRRCPDIGRAHKILGWEPKVQIDEGLDRTIHYFRSLKRA